MSKIFEKNLIRQALGTYWKRFAAWVTGLRTKYKQDLFFRTECNVILFQCVFALLLLFLVTEGFNYLYNSVTQTLIAGLLSNISHAEPVTGQTLFNSLQTIRSQNFWAIIFFFLGITIMAGYVAARVTLAPARNALSAQKRFISDIAHELRTPLSVIKTNCEVALLDETLDPEIRAILKSDIEELDRASEIINNLLTLNNLVRPEKINFTTVDLTAVAESASRKMRPLAFGKQIELSLRLRGDELRSVWGNATALEQIAINVISNAINFTPNGGQVLVTVDSDYRSNAVLSVEDTGIGIATKDLFHIFEPFYRAERSRNRQSGSSGLGLTIVSELVRLHSGRITVKSEVGRGTTATVMIPHGDRTQFSPPVSFSTERATDGFNEIALDFFQNS